MRMGYPLPARAMVMRFMLVAIVALSSLSFAAHAQSLRIRKELRNLNPVEYKMFIQGLAAMLSTPTEIGRVLYGPKYREMDYFIVKHAVTAMQPFGNPNVGNPSHFGPSFYTCHRAMTLEFENALLSVVPKLKALPWWDLVEDLKNGAYYQTPDSMYSNRWSGSKSGDPAFDYGVMDGIFGGRQIGRFNFLKYGHVARIFNGTAGTHLLRGPGNPQNNSYMVRYPASNLAQMPEPWPCYDPLSAPFCRRPGASRDFYPTPNFARYYEVTKGLEMPLTQMDIARCTVPSLTPTIWDFILCTDYPANLLSMLNTSVTDKWTNSMSAWSHLMFHTLTGSARVEPSPEGRRVVGDSRDTATAPNEVVAFFPFHAAVDRMFQVWMNNIKAFNPRVADPNVMYGFPTRPNCVALGPCPNPPVVLPGASLDDQIAPEMPFTDIFDYPTPNGVTHRDILNWNPDHIYDSMDILNGRPGRRPAH